MSSPLSDHRYDPAVAPVGRVKRVATCRLRVEIAFDDLDERHAQAIAAEMIARAHELANRREQECDVDVSVQLTPAAEPDTGGVERAVLAPLAAADEVSRAPTDGHLAPRAVAGQPPASP